jgi:hypothetical protein
VIKQKILISLEVIKQNQNLSVCAQQGLFLIAGGLITIGKKPTKALVEPIFDCLKKVVVHVVSAINYGALLCVNPNC